MAKILNIVTHPNKDILRKRSNEIDLKNLNSPEFKKLCEDMMLTMEKKKMELAWLLHKSEKIFA